MITRIFGANMKKLFIAIIFVLLGAQVFAQNFDKGLKAYRASDYETAFKVFEPLANKGMPEAQFYLGEMYKYGLGVLESKRLAERWHRKSALISNYDYSQYALGDLYSKALVPTKSAPEAIKWYRLALAQGNAQIVADVGIMLGRLYDTGSGGVLQDFVIAYMWYSVALPNGIPGPEAQLYKDWTQSEYDAMKLNHPLTRFTRLMTQADVTKAKAMARKCISSNYTVCGYFDAENLHVGLEAIKSSNYTIALQKLLPLALQGNADAQNQLGSMYTNGHGVPKDIAEGFRWYRLAAVQGHAQSQHIIGYMYNYEPLFEDKIMAYMWFNISSANFDDKYQMFNASVSRDMILSDMTPEEISKATAMARECMESDYKKCGY